FTDAAVKPIVGDFNYFGINYDGTTYDTDKDVKKGEYLFVLTAFSRYRERYFKPTHQVSEHIFKWELRDGSEEKIYKQIEDICL
ncbi:hypothetical protein CEJ90_15355, partial [Staphylococcus aureus]